MAAKSGSALAVWFGLNTGGAVFIGVWAYGIMSSGWGMGLLIGWLPALMAGVVAGLLVFGLTEATLALMRHRAAPSKAPTQGPPDGIAAH